MLYVVGVGPGDPDYVTLKALKTLGRCSAVAGWRSVLDRARGWTRGELVELTYRDQEEKLRRLAERSKSEDVCVVVHGDPTVSDWELMDRIRALGVPFEVVNGVSSLNLALAKMGLDVAQVVFFSQHASRPQRLERCGGRALAVFPPLDAEGRLRLWEELRGCEVYLLERLSLPGERARRVESAEELVSADPLAVVVAKCLN